MTPLNFSIEDVVARLDARCRRAEEEYPMLAAPDGTVAVSFKDLRALLTRIEPEAADRGVSEAWQPIETAPRNRKVLVAYRNVVGNWRVVTACYHTQLPWSDDEMDEHESEYAPEGWYEESDSHDTILRTSGEPLAWQPLPDPPAVQQEGGRD